MLLTWVVLLLARSAGVPALGEWFRLVPFHDALQVFRYAGAAWSMPCCILAAYATVLPGRVCSTIAAGALIFVTAAVCAGVAWPLIRALPGGASYLVASLAFGLLSLGAGTLALSREGRAAGAVLLLEAALLGMMPLLAGPRRPVLDRPGIAFLRDHLGLQRMTTLGPFSPNYPALFGLASINYSYLPVPSVWSDYVGTALRPGAEPVMFSGTFPVDQPGQPTNAEVFRARSPAYAALGVRYVVTWPGANPFDPPVPPGPMQAVVLMPDTVLTGTLAATGQAVGSVAIVVGTFAGRASGPLDFTLCAGAECRSGTAPFDAAADNQPLEIALDATLVATEPLHWTLRQRAGVPGAVWRWPGSGGLSPHIVLHAPGRFAAKAVYTDTAMTIFELPDPAPYFSAAGCTIDPVSRTEVVARCDHPATLIRRELAMPGWLARVGGQTFEPARSGPLFQSVALPSGASRVTFQYRPPGMRWFMALFALGVLMVLPWPRRRPTPPVAEPGARR